MSKDQRLSNDAPLAAERAQATGVASEQPADQPGPLRSTGWFSAQRKGRAVIRQLGGEDLETLSRQLGVTAAALNRWREEFLAAGTVALKIHRNVRDPRDAPIGCLKAKIGELTMNNNKLLYEKDRQLDEQLSSAQRTSRR